MLECILYKGADKMQIKRIIDISRIIHPGMTFWPYDGGFKITRQMTMKEGSHCNLSSIFFGMHTGTHVDAPYHFIDDAKNISALDLSKFIGLVKVIEIKTGKDIEKTDLQDNKIEKDDIVFFKTTNSDIGQDEPFFENYVAITLSAAEYLAEIGIKTVGIDYLSVEKYNSKKHDVHLALLSKEIGIVEGLYLKDVNPGTYFFSALPLYIDDVEGTPTRAVLIEFDSKFI